MKTVSFRTYMDTKFDMNILIDLITVPAHMRIDYANRNENIREGKTLCPRCDGTGNELFSMYHCCSKCNGTGEAI